MRAFLADVLSPAFDAVLPADATRVALRLRNAAAATGAVAGLLPRAGSLGTGTLSHANTLVLTYAGVAVLAHVVRARPGGDVIAGSTFLVAGAVVLAFGGTWGFVLAAAALLSVALSHLRRRMPPVPRPRDPPDPHPKSTFGWPPRFERIGYAVATALVFWMVVVEHTAVPTGSMQPTIYGNHMVAGQPRSGDHVLVDRAVYHLREPHRFEIVVFAYPLGAHIPFVKRLIGLPGETVEIVDGDIVIDGEIARKPPAVQASVWRELFPRKGGVGKTLAITDGWTASEDDGFRRAREGVLTLSPRGDEPGFLRYRSRLTTRDLHVACTVTPADDGARAIARLTPGGRDVTLEVGGGEPGRLVVDGGSSAEFEASLSGSTRLVLELADGWARAAVDGRTVAELPVPAGGGGRNTAAIGGQGGALEISAVELAEDLAYLPGAGGEASWTVPADAYFVLGDNAGMSEDSRAWTGRTFHVRGRTEPLIATDALPDLRGGQGANVRRTADTVRFIDRDGVAREISKADIEREEPAAPMPFVPRGNLRGRAAMIIFPFPPFGAWRPRLLP